MILFPFSDFWWFYLLFILFVVIFLALDLGIFHKKAQEVDFKEACIWTTIWVAAALTFNYIFYIYSKHLFSTDLRFTTIPEFDAEDQARSSALEFLTGFIVEKTLAIDNIFVFAMVFSYFGIPKIYQHRVLFWGILGTLMFRAFFISIGSILMQHKWVSLLFGIFLIATAIKMFFAGTKTQNLENNFLVHHLQKLFRIHPHIEGQKFFIKKNNLIYVTPLFVALVFLELSDIIFAIDSVPAIFALTKEPLIVFTSNIFAILGLRSMYFMLAGLVDKFVYLKYGLAAVLLFVGLKMVWLNELFGGKLPIIYSLSIIIGIICLSVLFSIIKRTDFKQNEKAL